MSAKKFVVELSRNQALKLDMLWCSCGHRPNNHFDHGDKPCAHCKCKKYEEEIYLPVDDT